MKINNILISITLLFLLTSCSAYFNQPIAKDSARLGEEVFVGKYTRDIRPIQPIVVGVYKFRDQTGQYKQVDNGVSYSTAVTQGATTILIKALEDSKWFTPIERENISNLLNERQIIRSTRLEQSKKNGSNKDVRPLAPLLFAGIILEGGIVSYDSNIITGGSGARYFGAGASTQYRQDRITIYLRAVSTSSGRILKTVYISKTILSQAIDVNLFRYVKLKRLLEVETGVSQNEPGQLAVKEAIEKAVESLIIEGIKSGVWQAREEQYVVDRAIAGYDHEKRESASTSLFNRRLENKRGSNSIEIKPYTSFFDGDYTNSNFEYGGLIGYKQYFYNSNISASISAGLMSLSNSRVFKKDFIETNANIEYYFLPNDKLTPFASIGTGMLTNNRLSKIYMKMQYGLGVEYLPLKKVGFRLYTERNHLFSDEIDDKIYGSHNDTYWVFGIGVNIFLNNK
jgi:curli production assembly/transport component CsgG